MSARNALQAFVTWLPYLDPLKNAFGCFLCHGHSLAFLQITMNIHCLVQNFLA